MQFGSSNDAENNVTTKKSESKTLVVLESVSPHFGKKESTEL